jgi:hypothetical protein
MVKNSMLILTGILLLTACQPASVPKASPEALPVPSAALTPSAAVGATAALAASEVVSVSTPTTADQMLRVSVDFLAKRLGIRADEIVVIQVKPVVWQDASLGCPKPGIDYIRIETPGFMITLDYGGTRHIIHTNQVNRTIECTPP